MIGKVTKGNDFTGLLSYVLDKPGAKYIGTSQLVGDHEHQWAAQFMRVAAKRRRTEYPVAHYSFSPHPNQPMADEAAYRYAQKFCQRMGHENCQWLLVRHTDTKTENGQDRDHFHLVVNRVTIDGTRTVSSFNDWYRSQAAHRALIEEFDLQKVPSVWETDRRNPSTGQIRRVRRQNREYAEGKRSTPADPIILTELQDRIDKFCQNRPDLTDLVERLLSSGVNVRIQPASNGGLGISYQLGSVAVAGSSLGRAYTVKGLQQRRGVAYYPAYDDPILKLYLKDQWYEWRYIDKNRNRPRIRQKPTSAELTPGERQEPAQKSKSTQPELSPASTSKAPAKPDLLNEEEYRQWVKQVAPVLDAYLKHKGVTIIEGNRFRIYKRSQDLVLEYRANSRTLMIAHNTSEGSWETRNYFPVERSIAQYMRERSVPSMQRTMRPPDAWFNLCDSGSQLSPGDVLNRQEYQHWVNTVAPVLLAYFEHHETPTFEGKRFNAYRHGQSVSLKQRHDSKTLMMARKTSEGSWEARTCDSVEYATAKYILSEFLPAMQRTMRPHNPSIEVNSSTTPPPKASESPAATPSPTQTPPPKPSQSPEAMPTPAPTSSQSPVATPSPTPTPSKSPVATPTPTPSPPQFLNEQEYQEWVNTVAPVLLAYFQHHETPTFEGKRFNAYRHGQSVSLKQRHDSQILMMARQTSEGSWEARTCYSVDRAPAKYILSEFLPAMQRTMRPDNPSIEVNSSSTTPTPKASESPASTPTPTPTSSPSPVATPSPTPTSSKSPVATPTSTPTPTPTPSPPDVLNEQEYQQWVNRVAPFLNTYLKHRGGRIVEGDRFRTYKRGQYLVLEYRDGSGTLIIGRPTGNGSWETPQQFSDLVKREDANHILEQSIPLMQRRMSQDKKRAQNKKRSRSRQLDISD